MLKDGVTFIATFCDGNYYEASSNVAKTLKNVAAWDNHENIFKITIDFSLPEASPQLTRNSCRVRSWKLLTKRPLMSVKVHHFRHHCTALTIKSFHHSFRQYRSRYPSILLNYICLKVSFKVIAYSPWSVQLPTRIVFTNGSEFM